MGERVQIEAEGLGGERLSRSEWGQDIADLGGESGGREIADLGGQSGE